MKKGNFIQEHALIFIVLLVLLVIVILFATGANDKIGLMSNNILGLFGG